MAVCSSNPSLIWAIYAVGHSKGHETGERMSVNQRTSMSTTRKRKKKKKHAINSAEDFFHAIPYLTENTTFIFRRLIMNSRVLCVLAVWLWVMSLCYSICLNFCFLICKIGVIESTLPPSQGLSEAQGSLQIIVKETNWHFNSTYHVPGTA